MLKVRIRGIEFRLSLLFPAVLVILFTIDRSGIIQWCVTASILHEAGHFIALFAFGNKPAQVMIGIFGVCVLQNPDVLMSYHSSRIVALSGPAVNLLIFSILYSMGGLSMPAAVHLAIGMFNLIPIEPLDGGQYLYYSLIPHMDEEKADKVSMAVSVAVLVPLATIGFYLLIQSRYNFTLFAVCIYLGLLLMFKRKR